MKVFLSSLLAFTFLFTAVYAQDAPPAAGTEAEKPKAGEKKRPDIFTNLPGIIINFKKKHIDLKGEICLQEGMLELVATVNNKKNHEAIVALEAKAQHIHLALLLLGMKPGKPGSYKYDENNKPIRIKPTGDKMNIFLVYTPEGKEEEVVIPVNELMKDLDGKPKKDNTFLFTGSAMTKNSKGKSVYMAENGNAVSIVSFGDDLISYTEVASHSNEDLVWGANPKKVPALGKKVMLRIVPIKKEKEK